MHKCAAILKILYLNFFLIFRLCFHPQSRKTCQKSQDCNKFKGGISDGLPTNNFLRLELLWTPRGKDPHTFWGCNCSFWSLNYVPVLLLTSFWRSFLFLHRVLMSTVQGQVAPQNITTNQNFLFWSLHSLESNCYQNKRYSDLKGALQRDPCSKRALLEETWFT